jgi:hypothetical protein
MVDFSFVGKEGIIVQYEDIISMVGFNVIRYLRAKNANEKAMGMSLEDILLSYINREKESPEIWLKNEFGIDFKVEDYLNSINAFQPNWLYSYKLFDAAYKNGTKKLIVYSIYDIPIIKNILISYPAPVEFATGDIKSVLEKNINATLMTASTETLNRCLETDVPAAITIVDDFLHLAPAVIGNIGDKLKEKNKYVCYTSIRSGGLINLDK